MWSETIGLRTRPVWDQKIGLGLGLAGLVLFCETRSCYVRRHNDLEVHINFSSTIVYSGLGTSLQWRSTVAFTYLKVKSAKWQVPLFTSGGLGLKSLVLFTSLVGGTYGGWPLHSWRPYDVRSKLTGLIRPYPDCSEIPSSPDWGIG